MSQNMQDVQKELAGMKRMLNELRQIVLPLARNYKPSEDMTADEVMEYLHIGKETLRRLRYKSVLIGYTSTGKNHTYKRSEVEEYKYGHKGTDMYAVRINRAHQKQVQN